MKSVFGKFRVLKELTRLPSGVYLFIVVLVTFTLLSPHFLSVRNVTNILLAGSPAAILSLGIALVMLTNSIDLSIGSCMSFISVLTASLLSSGFAILPCILLSILAGVAVGLFNGFFVAKFKLPAFIVTLGTMGITEGIALLLGGGQTIYWEKNWFNRVALSYFLGLPVVFWIVIFIFAIVLWIVHLSRFGRNIYGIGSNEEALRLCGVKINLQKILVFVLHGSFVGIAGVMITSRVASGNPIIGVGLEFEAIAAAAVGGISFVGGKGHPGFAMLSAFTITMLLNGLGLVGMLTSIQYVFVGLILIIGMSMNALLEKLRFA